jgi:CBS domain-containing protein
MSYCPYCGHKNIVGADACEGCEQPLADLHLPTPATEVERALLADRVRRLNPKKPIIIKPDMPVGDVLRLLVNNSVGCALVEEDGKLVGIFSERDALLRLNTEAAALAGRPIREFMTPSPLSLQADAKIAFAVQRMDVGDYRHVPIVNAQGRAVGVISVRDILRYLTEKMAASTA